MQSKHMPLWSMTALALPWALGIALSDVPRAQSAPVDVVPPRVLDARSTGVVAATQATEPVGLRRRALLVGIGRYPSTNDWPSLAGPPADVEAVRAALISRSGFAPADIAVLVDEQATRAAILAGFRRMIADAARGDLVLFYFAGHGSLLPDDDGDELDRWDETLVPYDAVAGGGKHNDIRDEEIGELIRQANTKTDQVVLIFDCCSSGTNTRDGAEPAKRYIEPKKRGLDAARISLAPVTRAETGSGYVPPSLRYVSLAACRANESAYEMPMEALGSEEPAHARGLFSFCLVEALLEIDPALSYVDWMVETQSRVGRRNVDQTPIIEGSLATYRMFQPVASGRARRFELARSEAGELTVACGRLHGLEAGALLSVCPITSLRDSAAERVGCVRLVDVGSAQSRAEWTEAPRASETPARWAAFLLEHGPAADALAICVQGGDARGAELGLRVDAAPLLARAEADRASLVVEWRVDGANPRWQVCLTDGALLPLSADPEADDEMDRLCDNLNRLGVAAHTARSLSTEDLAALAFDLELEHLDDDRRFTGAIVVDAAGKRRVHEGRPFACRVTNRSQLSFYATLVVISPDGDVCLIDPPTPDDKIAPGQTAVVATALVVPPGHRAFYDSLPVRLAMVVTPVHHDLHALEAPAVSIHGGSRGAAETDDGAARTRVLANDPWNSKLVDLWIVPSEK